MKFISVLLLVVFFNSGPMAAELKYLKGTISVTRNNEVIKSVQKGMKILDNDIINTGENSLAIIKGETFIIKAIENSSILIDEHQDKYNIKSGGAIFKVDKFLKRERQFRVETISSGIGVRGTIFFSYINKDNGSFISVKEGAVDFKGTASKELSIIPKDLSSMTNIKNENIKVDRLGFEDKINWSINENENMEQSPELFIALEKTWSDYKDSVTISWENFSNDQNDAWKKLKN